ncbi:G protein coupled receptor family protein [Clathrospora elynae]|uniref:G protein coupled receptor family protein n=1 Tax=Clathrospora elynae TaxID=706981 RepID=A0A6A5SX59_9PLEO|nr:G protein coupled receptor family protein [Clathrospora elynae]
MARPLSPEESYALVAVTRTTSVFSVIGSAIIISTFLCFPFFRKPINRLVFFATMGNLLANVATLMSTSVLPNDLVHVSGLCEFQGTLIQWFMMADSFWVLCMAMNVFLVFFYGYDAQQIRHLEKFYFAFSYGIPGIPALTYLILDHTGHRIMGSATLWCWVTIDVDWLRIAFFYAPVWVVISATMTIYSVTGYRIWQKRAELRSFSRNSVQPSAIRSSLIANENQASCLTASNSIVVTTQINCDVQQQEFTARCVSPELDDDSISSFSSTRLLSNTNKANEHKTMTLPAPVATAFATNTSVVSAEVPAQSASVRPSRKAVEGHAAAMAYFWVAFLMFIALFVVWVPSTINRLYQFIHKDNPSFGLNIISAIVLPLQGAWNATIYIFTTRAECKRAHSMIVSKLTGKPFRYQPRQDQYRTETTTSSRETRDSHAEIALDEMLKEGTQVRHCEVDTT